MANNNNNNRGGNNSGPSNRGFASMNPEQQREIASKGGKASGGNFANDRERAAEAGRKGGEARAESRNGERNSSDRGSSEDEDK
jgi:general stress protein YciG